MSIEMLQLFKSSLMRLILQCEKLLENKRGIFVPWVAVFLMDCFVRKLQEIYVMT